MDRSYPFSRRIAHRLHYRRRALAAMSAGMAASAIAFALLPAQAPYSPPAPGTGIAPAAPAAVPSADPVRATRPVYRYSVVPGGAADRAGLERILRSDRVAAAHYAGFDAARARPVTVPAPRAVYVSYRKGDQIYWTGKKVMLQAGETLLTEGSNEMRARCANRISDVPRFPVEAHAPGLEALDEIVDKGRDGTAGDIAYVDAPDDELAELSGQPFQLVWPADAAPAGEPRPGRPPFSGAPAPALPWPPAGWFGNAGLPPLAGATPRTQLLASSTPPPLARGFALDPDPAPGAPLDAAPPPALTDVDPFIPRADPGQPAAPSNPPLDLPRPADVPEPATPWLAAAALVALLALLALRRQR